MEKNNKIVLFDGNSIFYRAFYALPLLKTENGYSNAVYGFANILIKTIQMLQPTHIAVAFDVSKKTFRNEIFADYKKGRKPMPPELVSQITPLKEMLAHMNICVLEKLGLEGDDILGTIAHRFNENTVIVTGDRDCFQLIDDSTTICRTIKGVSEVAMMDENAFKKEWGVLPIQIIDLKALAGDKSDNIPGVAGVGDKTALELVQKYGSVEGIYEHIDEISGKLHEKLVTNKEMAYISKRLATINERVEIECTLSDMEFEFPFSQEVRKFFEKYEFRSLLKRSDIWNDEISVQNIQTVSCNNIQAKSLSEIDSVLENSKNTKQLSIFLSDDNCRIEISSGQENVFLEVEHSLLPSFSILDVFAKLQPFLHNSEILKVFFDAKTAFHTLFDANIEIPNNYFDVSVAKYLVDGATVKDCFSVLEMQGYSTSTIAFSILQLKNELLPKIESKNLQHLFFDVELPLVSVLFEMENVGFKVDTVRMETLGREIKKDLGLTQKQIFDMVGFEFNLNSPKQLAEVLFEKLNLPHGKKVSTDVDTLTQLENLHPVISLILKFRKLAKLDGTYIEGLAKHIDKNNLIHTNFKQTLTTTGRLSSTEPNLQNLPIRSSESKEIRSMFVASSSDNILIDADYSQIELRMLAHMSNEQNLIDSFSTGRDIHSDTACRVFDVSPQDVTPQMRRNAKIVNFGVIYGMSDFGLANDLGVPTKVAKKYIDEYFREHSQVDQFMKNCVKTAKETGEVHTILNRIRKMVDISSPNYMVRMRAERASQNAPVQGSAADVIKVAMVNVANRLKKEKLNAKLIMQVHDELLVDCPLYEKNKVEEILRYEMEHAIELKVPLVVDIQSAYRWSDAH